MKLGHSRKAEIANVPKQLCLSFLCVWGSEWKGKKEVLGLRLGLDLLAKVRLSLAAALRTNPPNPSDPSEETAVMHINKQTFFYARSHIFAPYKQHHKKGNDFRSVREHLLKKECFLSGIAWITSPPPFLGNLYLFFWTSKNDVLRVWQKNANYENNDPMT